MRLLYETAIVTVCFALSSLPVESTALGRVRRLQEDEDPTKCRCQEDDEEFDIFGDNIVNGIQIIAANDPICVRRNRRNGNNNRSRSRGKRGKGRSGRRHRANNRGGRNRKGGNRNKTPRSATRTESYWHGRRQLKMGKGSSSGKGKGKGGRRRIFPCPAPPTAAPTAAPMAGTAAPVLNFETFSPTSSPSLSPSLAPSASPSEDPSGAPSEAPSGSPSQAPSSSPSQVPSSSPSGNPSSIPTSIPSATPSAGPTFSPTVSSMPSSLDDRSETFSPTQKPCDRSAVYGSCDRVFLNTSDACASRHECTDFPGPPFSPVAVSGGYYNWTGGLPPEPFLLLYEGQEVGFVTILPNRSYCSFEVERGYRIMNSKCHIAERFPSSLEPKDFVQEGCSHSSPECILLSYAELESTTCTPTPTSEPTSSPTKQPTDSPTGQPTYRPTVSPSSTPSTTPSLAPSTLAPTTIAFRDTGSNAPVMDCGTNSPSDVVNIRFIGPRTCAWVALNPDSCRLQDISRNNDDVSMTCARQCKPECANE